MVSLDARRRLRDAEARDAKKKAAAAARLRPVARGGAGPMVNWRRAPRFLVAALLMFGAMWLVQRLLAVTSLH